LSDKLTPLNISTHPLKPNNNPIDILVFKSDLELIFLFLNNRLPKYKKAIRIEAFTNSELSIRSDLLPQICTIPKVSLDDIIKLSRREEYEEEFYRRTDYWYPKAA
jgi:hypothetical protein